MKLFTFPDKKEWPALATRNIMKSADLNAGIDKIFRDIRNNGDKDVLRYTFIYDKIRLKKMSVNNSEIIRAERALAPQLAAAIRLAKRNITKFHSSQVDRKKTVQTSAGVFCWRESRAISRIGIYIPGGSAPLFSTVLMLGIPAKLAGCEEIILCTPPGKQGRIDPAILFAAKLVGIKTIFKAGGIQAIGAMTFGTESIPRVDKIFGPGNQYVTAAKQAAQNFGVAIDLPAGPSELLIIADKTSDPEFLAADLLSQAEHGADSQVILLSDQASVIAATIDEIKKQLRVLPRKAIAAKALKNSKAILLGSISECIEFSDLYAPEHLIIAAANPKKLSGKIKNAGSVFLGNYSCESAGDYASGTNHTLPTNGYARNYSGVSLDSFVKKITFQEVTRQGIRKIGPSIELMAEAEQLQAHRNAVSVRLNKLNKQIK